MATNGAANPGRADGNTEGAYLFVRSELTGSEGAAFFHADNVAIGERICRLLSKIAGANQSEMESHFDARPASAFDEDERLLLDEELEFVELLASEPDLGAFSFTVTELDRTLRDYYARAEAWDRRIRHRQSKPDSPAGERQESRGRRCPSEREVANAVVAAAAVRDLAQTRRHYPGSVNDEEGKRLFDVLVARLEDALERPCFAPLRDVYEPLDYGDSESDALAGLLMAAFLMMHPTLDLSVDNEELRRRLMAEKLGECQQHADTELQRAVTRIHEIMLIDCRVPQSTGQPEFGDPRRHLQMLRHYWDLCRDILLHLADAECGFQPFPLLPLVENLRERMHASFAQLSSLSECEEASRVVTGLLEHATIGEVDDLSAAPEWTRGQIAVVDQYLARAQLQLGSGTFSLTAAEDLCLKVCTKQIAEYKQRVSEEWRRILARANASNSQPSQGQPNRNRLPLVDENRFTVVWGGRECLFSKRQKQLFDLLSRLLQAAGRSISFDTLRQQGNVWDGYEVEDSTIRGAVKRLRNHLTGKGLLDVAGAIHTFTYRRQAYVRLDPEKLESKSH